MPDDDPSRVETCCLLLSTINIHVFDVLIISFLLYLPNLTSKSASVNMDPVRNMLWVFERRGL